MNSATNSHPNLAFSPSSDPPTVVPVGVTRSPRRSQVSVELDSDYYRSGVEARRRAHTAALADVTDLVDDVEDRIEQLLERTLQLIGSSDSGGST